MRILNIKRVSLLRIKKANIMEVLTIESGNNVYTINKYSGSKTKVSLFKRNKNGLLKFIGDFRAIIEAKYYIKTGKLRFQESLWN